MHLERALIPPEKMNDREFPYARERDISLPKFKHLTQVHHSFVQAHSLAFMHGYRPGKPQRELCNPRKNSSPFFHRPACSRNLYLPPAPKLYYRIIIFFGKSFHSAERAVHISFFRIILCKHNGSSCFETISPFTRSTSALGDKSFGALFGASAGSIFLCSICLK